MANKRRKNNDKIFGLPKSIISGVLTLIIVVLGAKFGTSGDFLKNFEETQGKVDDALSQFDEILYGEDSAETPSITEGTLRVDVIDVGQGESILITTAEKAVLIDAGENDKGQIVIDFLKSRGITELDLAIGTHAHSDHIGGMDTVLSQIPTEEFWIGKMPDKLVPTTKTYLDVLKQIESGNITYKEPEVGTEYDLGGGGTLTVFGPQGEPDDLNNCSIICRIDFGETSFLFSGDAETPQEKLLLQSGVDLDVDVMTMGHHGSSTSSSKAYFEAASPEFAIISCGEGNSYGHPHKETVKKLKDADVKYHRTDLNGTITVITNGKNIEYSTEK